jgi:hypothetical protein
MRNSILLILFIGICLLSCKKDREDVAPVDIGHDYAALTLGKYVVYDVDSFYYDDFTATIDTFNFQIREEVAESYTDLEGDEAFKIERYRKDHDTLSWVLADVWNAKLTQTNYQKVEENVRYVKLIFPVRENSSWNGNIMNNMGSQTYDYDEVDVAETIGTKSFNKVLTVDQLEELNLIEQKLSKEKFAKGVGMVYRKNMDLVRNNLTAPWRGYDVTYTVNSYGG